MRSNFAVLLRNKIRPYCFLYLYYKHWPCINQCMTANFIYSPLSLGKKPRPQYLPYVTLQKEYIFCFPPFTFCG